MASRSRVDVARILAIWPVVNPSKMATTVEKTKLSGPGVLGQPQGFDG